ncbi:hypothetical protein FB451DRAFT_712300 [Mycena latifolia]|nr:hypothetical protein FB451DRAFT_712300 [Mycena latifolia]
MASPSADATPDVQARPAEAKFLLVQSVEGEDLNMASPPLKEARSSNEFIDILVPSELVYNATKAAHDDDSGSSGDEISIHVEGPAEHDESLSSSALTAVASTDEATATEDPCAAPQRRSRVRFRSRVRITSGLHHLRRLSATSSLNSSSSSISAPLRSPLTEENCSPGWGTLGQRVNLFAVSNRQAAALAAQARGAKQRARRRQGLADLVGNGAAGERTALLGAAPPPGYDGHPSPEDEDEEEYFDSDNEYDEEAVLSRQIDLVFGKWPGRLLNRHWWWWQLQPIVSCGCLDESDSED